MPPAAERPGGEAVDDPAAASLDHRRQHCLCAEQWAPEVDVDDSVPLVDGHVAQPVLREVRHDGGVVDEDVDAAERVDGRRAPSPASTRDQPRRPPRRPRWRPSAVELVGEPWRRQLSLRSASTTEAPASPSARPYAMPMLAGTAGDHGDLPAQVEELRGVHRAVLSAGLDASQFVVEYRGCERFSQVL